MIKNTFSKKGNTMSEKKMQWLLIVVAVLLSVNLVCMVADWLIEPDIAQADIVSGKNWFTTSTPDGSTLYLWQYWSSGVGPQAEASVQYYGMIKAGGEFVER